MIRDVEIEHAATELRELLDWRLDLHARRHRGGARGGVTLATLDLDEAQAAGAEAFSVFRSAQLRHFDFGDGALRA
jgi:hypothetical protein